MATSSIYENVIINDAMVAEALINAIEESEKAKNMAPVSYIESRIATKEDSARLREMRMKEKDRGSVYMWTTTV